MLSFLLALLVAGAFASRTVKVTVSNCTKDTSEAHVQHLEVTPDKQQVGQNFTISGDGIAKVNVPGGYFNATAQWEGVPIYKTSGDACKPDTIVLPLDVGEIYYGGTKCPLTTNEDVPVSVVGIVHPDAPDATVHIRMAVTDSSTKAEVFCVLCDIDIGTLEDK